MGAKITDTEMTSDQTRYTGRRARGGWAVTWLPGRTLTHSQAGYRNDDRGEHRRPHNPADCQPEAGQQGDADPGEGFLP